MKARIALLVLVLALAAGLAACTSSVTAPTPDRPVVTGTPLNTEQVGFGGGMGNGH
jgi:hypothetical protein